MGRFDTDYNKLMEQDTPVTLRTPVRLAMLKAYMAPVIWLYNMFMANRAANLYYLAHTSQVCYMQAALNDTFDYGNNRIVIVDDVPTDAVYTYLAAENKPVYTYLASENKPVYTYTAIEAATGHYSFIVEVPAILPFDMARMRAMIDKYRLPGTSNYLIRLV